MGAAMAGKDSFWPSKVVEQTIAQIGLRRQCAAAPTDADNRRMMCPDHSAFGWRGSAAPGKYT